MTKLPDEDDDILYKGDVLIVRAMLDGRGQMPAKEYVDGLDKAGRGQFYAAMKIFESNVTSGRSGGRASPVPGSEQKLWELRITPKGGTPPHHRLFFRRHGKIIWAAIGITKKSNKLKPRDITRADNLTAQWLENQEGTI